MPQSHSLRASPPKKVRLTSGIWLALSCVALLQGCSWLKPSDTSKADGDHPVVAQNPIAFTVEVHSDNGDVAKYLDKHLELQRFTRFPDLKAGEFSRLLTEADTNARDLLAALGYFNPTLSFKVVSPEAGSQEPPKVRIDVAPGPQTVVEKVSISFDPPMGQAPNSLGQREQVEQAWSLKDGQVFTQSAWGSAKSAGLRVLQSYRYPTAKIAHSQARIEADDNTADLSVRYDAGPAYRFGPVELQGNVRYDAQGIKNIARIPVGSDYSEEALLDAQERLTGSGYFDSAFLMLDMDAPDPQNAPVIAQLREAKYQKLVFGLGVSTDAGLRFSIDHINNKMWPFGWRAINKLSIDSKSQLLSTQWTAMPHASGWAWFTGAQLERTDLADYTANTLTLTAGRTKSVGHIDRRTFLQYDFSRTEGSNSIGSSSSILASYSWTGRYFDNKINPTKGYGIALELGGGYTLTPDQDPFMRVRARGLTFVPVGKPDDLGRRDRLALRADAGGIVSRSDVQVPLNLLFLSGGDTTVRGYSYQSIGVYDDHGRLTAGRYMVSGGVEWLRPMTLFGNTSDWEHAVFVDVGTVAKKLNKATVYTGVGTGIRWRSPVGPMQADVAYGLKTQEFRLHLRMGFNF